MRRSLPCAGAPHKMSVRCDFDYDELVRTAREIRRVSAKFEEDTMARLSELRARLPPGYVAYRDLLEMEMRRQHKLVRDYDTVFETLRFAIHDEPFTTRTIETLRAMKSQTMEYKERKALVDRLAEMNRIVHWLD